MSYTIVHDAAELVVGPADDLSGGVDTDSVTLEAGGVLDTRSDAAVVLEDGIVIEIGSSDELVRQYPIENAAAAVDATGQCVLPGFVDAHTHALFVGDRSDEFEAKLRGQTYQEILAEGGGILRTVRRVREASEQELRDRLLEHLDVLLAHGTTTVEVKSGYGLNTETELKMLSAIDGADDEHPVDVVATFMGAHAIPEGADADDYVDSVVEDQLPAVADQGIAEFCDVFCEEGVFTLEQSRRVLEAGATQGLTPKIHADEFERLGGTRLAAELGAASADHLLQSTDWDVRALLSADVTPVLLPGTAFGLGEGYPDLEPYRKRGAVPAIATDFNPNCHAPSPGFAATLACVGMGMTPAEAVVGITERGAAAIDRDRASGGAGTLTVGAPGDLVVIDGSSHRHLPYNFGVNVVETVLKAGEIVVSRHP
ncbi:Imidazolonepropionase or related amidohydrolase [Halalkaliarchaeum sp. AArc-CO]|uniref:imidazolonepropionase n=1 Tax=Halalkaliarchaeum sp. AArc-CO TaxID=2866381 RepID=UPI00217DC2B4|nr:imidazolonepropionase [Halalkaliarchaeum sp. AArc-CO]UWG51622.1 Imidazolonepropionase or related amidohydrolase [Halalkaliarchaeum sp. AArc-CO]